MTIRGKVLLILSANLFVGSIVLAAALLAVLLEEANALALETAKTYGKSVGRLLEAKPVEPLEVVMHTCPETTLIDGWVLTDREGRVVAGGGTGRPFEGTFLLPKDGPRFGFSAPPLPVRHGNTDLILLVSTSVWRFFPADFSLLIGTLLVTVGVVMFTLYALMARLIVDPVRALASASHMLRAGGEPVPLSGHTRTDEMGSLIRSFNDMVREVSSYRKELERRVEDATERRLAAEQSLIRAQRISATSRLAAGIAHEINNPLSGIINAVHALAADGLSDEKRRQYLELATDGLSRIRSVVERMLSFQKGRKVASVDLREVIREALSLASSKTRDIRVEAPALEEPLVLEADSAELVQVLLNLIINSAEALRDAASPQITVTAARQDACAVINVSDNGPGMDETALRHAFDLFYSAKPEGTGLGLAISLTIVQNHGGDIDISSTPGKGTNVCVTLPLKSPQES